MGSLRVIVALVVALGAAIAAHAEVKRTKTVVVGIQGRRGVDKDLARALSDVVQSVLTEDTSRVVLGRDDIAQVVQLEAEKQAMGCSDSSCLSEVATAMDADRIVTGTMDKVGASFLIVVTEIDARRLEPVARVEATVPTDESHLIEAVRKLARDLVAKSPRMGQGGPGTLVITSSPSGAQVIVDGKQYGNTPARIEPIASGRHKLTLRPIGTPSVDVEIPIAGGGQTAVDVRVGTLGTVTEAQKKDHAGAVFWHNTLAVGKLVTSGVCDVTGCTLCCFGCAVASVASTPEDPYIAGTLIAFGALAALPGLGLGTWGVLDFFNPPAPLAGEPVPSHVVITPPQGDPQSFEVPFVTEMAQ